MIEGGGNWERGQINQPVFANSGDFRLCSQSFSDLKCNTFFQNTKTVQAITT